ncbi:MAG TPA: bifunctional hydroxymethylpyrimidine kinase/phosphomethylpyrimidine kinase [Methanothrix sp.]|nr:bifunctional hydroxymethylpyrimidine kinase/phosphomethylpyrimidine kinase [Methanothrix sp.]HOK58555.1 bifunctional hydroxymethylpyrimidine kinase/phosphomethylpyrimidine kinase [Methanothrix sp.]HOL43724.1 bifunctional hydroxymethylpyrimidine kinase/phosphomethylpyrimidine kinase [Methanothrix sp.]HPO88718.1 bifunctional hydroxymethylpyrimidine kinase/phosphomethylpyrimidine kinase [Methanothrix sp.]
MERSVLTVGGSDSGGGAGIQADLKTFAALGVHGLSVVAAVTAQNTLGVRRVFPIPAEMIAAQLDAVAEDFNISWAKTGMLFSPEAIYLVAERLRALHRSVVVDPVIAAEAGGSLIADDAIPALVEELIPVASVVTPNIFEAEAITGVRICDLESAREAALRIVEMGARAVVVTGGHLECRAAGLQADECVDLLVTEDESACISGRRRSGGNHGVGCTYSAALTAYLSMGMNLQEAARHAHEFAAQSIEMSRPVGHGAAPVDQAACLRRDAERFRVISSLDHAVSMLKEELMFVGLIPEVGSNIGMAIPGARSDGDVAAVEGRIVRAGRRAHVSGCIRFGASRHIARIVLTAMRFDPGIRAAMNIRLGEDLLSEASRMGLRVSSFDRGEEPPGESTMSWGTARAIERLGAVPDIIWDAGGVGKEPMIRILGRDAVSVATVAIMLSRAVGKR